VNSDELERTDVIVIVLQAKANDLAHAFHEGVESLGLGVATAKGGNSGDIIACFVLLDQYGELSFWLHARTLLQKSLSRRGQAIGIEDLMIGI
jgi:sulfur relay (sulfurtransferase) DsrF/TusC family protein